MKMSIKYALHLVGELCKKNQVRHVEAFNVINDEIMLDRKKTKQCFVVQGLSSSDNWIDLSVVDTSNIGVEEASIRALKNKDDIQTECNSETYRIIIREEYETIVKMG